MDYADDFELQKSKKQFEDIQKNRKIMRKMDKLSKKNRYVKPKK